MDEEEQLGMAGRLGVTRGRMITIGVLVVVFVVITIVQMGDSNGPASSDNENQPGSKAPLVTDNLASESSNTAEPSTKRRVSDIALTEVIRHDPFARPSVFNLNVPPPAPASNDEQAKSVLRLNRLRRSGVEMVLVTSTGPIAVIDGKQLRIGDRLEGRVVTSITSEGIRLSAVTVRGDARKRGGDNE